MNLKGKIALITGASRGIGYSILQLLSQRGAIVIGTATSELGSHAISSYLGSKGKGMQLSVLDIISIKKCIEQIYLEFGKIDILVNNVGIVSDSLLVYMTENKWNSVINTNLTSVFRMSKAVIRGMLKQHYGRIITIGSVIGSIGNAGQTNYAATKAGLIGLSKSLAKEVASRGITVNVIAPGFIMTDMTKSFTDQHLVSIISQIPAKRLGKPSEVANVVAFLASEEAAYITGETIHINGGMYMV